MPVQIENLAGSRGSSLKGNYSCIISYPSGKGCLANTRQDHQISHPFTPKAGETIVIFGMHIAIAFAGQNEYDYGIRWRHGKPAPTKSLDL